MVQFKMLLTVLKNKQTSNKNKQERLFGEQLIQKWKLNRKTFVKQNSTLNQLLKTFSVLFKLKHAEELHNYSKVVISNCPAYHGWLITQKDDQDGALLEKPRMFSLLLFTNCSRILRDGLEELLENLVVYKIRERQTHRLPKML